MTKALATKSFTLAALVAAVSLAAVADAGARTRSHQATFTGPHGTTTASGARTCAAGAGCVSQGGVTGPRGETATRQGAASCANGVCSSSATVTGPDGRGYTRSASATPNQ